MTQVVLVLSHIIRWRSRGVMSPGFPSKLHSRWVRISGSRVRSSRSPLIMVGFFSSHFSSMDHGPFRPFQPSINTDGLSGRDRGRAQSRRRVRERPRRLNTQSGASFCCFWVCSNSIVLRRLPITPIRVDELPRSRQVSH